MTNSMLPPPAQALKGNPRREAVATIEAYDYQIWRTLEQWLMLGPDEVLYLECAEDFDVCSETQSQTNQVKSSPRDISFASEDVQDAIHNYWNLVKDNPEAPSLKMRFLTRGGVRLERPARFDGRKGLHVWASAAAGSDEDAVLLAQELPKLLKRHDSGVVAFLANASASALRERLFKRIDWVVNEPHIDQIIGIVERLTLDYGELLGYPPDQSSAAVHHLIAYCYKTVRLARPELRRLTPTALHAQFFDATAIKLPFNYEVAKRLSQRVSNKPTPSNILGRIQNWLALHALAHLPRPNRRAAGWGNDKPTPAYQIAKASLSMSGLEPWDTGPVCFQGRQRDAIVPALCLWAESGSLSTVPGLMLVDTKASALQDTVLWSGAVKLGLEAPLQTCRYVDLRSENIALALCTTAKDWVNSLLYALPITVHERLQRSGFAHLLEVTIEAIAAPSGTGEKYGILVRAVEQALLFLCKSEPMLPPQLHGNSENDQDVALRMDFESYLDRQCPADVSQLAELRRQLDRKHFDLGLILAHESQHRPAIVLFDSSQPASLVLAGVIHSLYYWRYVGWELRNQGIHTRPILYFSDAVNVPVARFVVESFAANTCIVNGPAPMSEDEWPNNKPHRVQLVEVNGNSFVHAGRRVQYARSE
jgi:hypothetical protein